MVRKPRARAARGIPAGQDILYGMMAWRHSRTGEDRFRAPFDAVQSLATIWLDAGAPETGAAPPPGGAELWCGGRLAGLAHGAAINLAQLTGIGDWSEYIERFGGPYARFVMNPTDVRPLLELENPQRRSGRAGRT